MDIFRRIFSIRSTRLTINKTCKRTRNNPKWNLIRTKQVSTCSNKNYFLSQFAVLQTNKTTTFNVILAVIWRLLLLPSNWPRVQFEGSRSYFAQNFHSWPLFFQILNPSVFQTCVVYRYEISKAFSDFYTTMFSLPIFQNFDLREVISALFQGIFYNNRFLLIYRARLAWVPPNFYNATFECNFAPTNF